MNQTMHRPLWRPVLWTTLAALLLAPAVAMRFTSEVNWTLADFVFAGVVLGGLGVATEVTVRRSGNGRVRAGVVLALVASVLLLWVMAAVGYVGDGGDASLNRPFLLVIAVAWIGSAIARFRPTGMAVAMIAAAAVHAAAFAFAWMSGGFGQDLLFAAVATALFVAMWLGAAALLRRADA